MSYESTIPDFCGTLKEYVSIRSLKQPIEEILIDQANKLCCSNFGEGNQGLYQEAKKVAPSKDELLALPVQLNWHIKRASGPVFTEFETVTLSKGKNKGQQRIRAKKGTQKGEIDKRISHRSFQAICWLSTKLNKYAPGNVAAVNKSIVVIKTDGTAILSVSIRNTAQNALEVAERTGYLQRALDDRKADLLVYINRHLDQASDNFKQMMRK